MRDTLEDLYYGNITPCDKRIKSGSPLQQVLDEAEQLTELLEARLDRDGKDLLHRLGMRLTVEGLLGGDDSCLSDITEGV